jgi:hypothetical protein
MASQVARTRKQKDSYSRVNASYAGSGLLMPGHNDSKDKKTPVLDIYFDNSGSWGESDVKKGNECLDKLTEMEDRKQLKINRFYFANTVHSDSRWDGGWSEGGTSAYPEIL